MDDKRIFFCLELTSPNLIKTILNGYSYLLTKKSRIREKPNLSTDADKSTDTKRKPFFGVGRMERRTDVQKAYLSAEI